jgi:hypothetical protein
MPNDVGRQDSPSAMATLVNLSIEMQRHWRFVICNDEKQRAFFTCDIFSESRKDRRWLCNFFGLRSRFDQITISKRHGFKCAFRSNEHSRFSESRLDACASSWLIYLEIYEAQATVGSDVQVPDRTPRSRVYAGLFLNLFVSRTNRKRWI